MLTINGQSGKTTWDVMQIDQTLCILVCRKQNQGVGLTASVRVGESTVPALLFWPFGPFSFNTWTLCSHLNPLYPPAEEDWAQESHSPSLLLISCVTLGRLLNFGVYGTSAEKVKIVNNNAFLIGLLCRLYELLSLKQGFQLH